MRCGVKTAHPAHDDIQRLGHYCVGVTADDAVAYAIMDAAEELARRWTNAWGDTKALPDTCRIEMHPMVMSALWRQTVYPPGGPSTGTSVPITKIFEIPVAVRVDPDQEPGWWRLIVSSGRLGA